MLSNASSFLQVALTALTLASLVGLGLLRGVVTNLRERLEDRRHEIEDLERELTKVKTENTTQMVQLQKQEEALVILKSAIGEANWTEISRKLDEHHSEAKSHWTADEELLGLILQAMRERK